MELLQQTAKMMDVLKFLKSIRSKRLLLNTLDLERKQLQSELFPSGIRYDRDRVQTSPSDRMPDIASDLLDLDKAIEVQITELSRDIHLANEVISQIQSPEYQQLLHLRYIVASKKNPRGIMNWEEVASEMGYSTRHVMGYMHGKAIAEARKIWKKVNTP